MAKDTYTDIHMALPNGAASCGSDGPAEPDVNLATCLKCLETLGWPRRTTDAVEKAKRQTYTSVNGNMRKIARRIVAGKDAGDDTLRKTIEWIGNLNDAG